MLGNHTDVIPIISVLFFWLWKNPGHLSYNTSVEKDVSTNKEEVTIEAKQKSVSQGVNALEFYLYHY